MPAISEELIAAYHATHYRVFTAAGILILRIGCYSEPLVRLFQRHEVLSGAFLTAYNPFSKQMDDAANKKAQSALLVDLSRNGYAWLDGAGTDSAGQWQEELSVFVLGITYDQAAAIAKAYHQHAFVYADARAVPQLALLSS
jgi:hypothetical protein